MLFCSCSVIYESCFTKKISSFLFSGLIFWPKICYFSDINLTKFPTPDWPFSWQILALLSRRHGKEFIRSCLPLTDELWLEEPLCDETVYQFELRFNLLPSRNALSGSNRVRHCFAFLKLIMLLVRCVDSSNVKEETYQ